LLQTKTQATEDREACVRDSTVISLPIQLLPLYHCEPKIK